jgi:hypothetical protein
MAERRKWVLLVAAHDQMTAEIWKDILVQEGVPAVINPADAISFLGLSNQPCRIMVLEEYLKRAREVLEGIQAEEPPGDTEPDQEFN